ncbi:MAG: chromate efflux transporter [Vicinamibacteria bacterium]
MDASAEPVVAPTFRDAIRFWFRLGLISFGGPGGQIALLHRETVERRRWIDDERFSKALAFCTFLPWPEAQQLATWIGWFLHGTRGAIVAGVLFVLPASVLLLGLSWLRASQGALPIVAAVLSGLRPVIAAIVLDAAWSMARRRLQGTRDRVLALVSLVAALSGALFPVVVALAGIVGWFATSSTILKPLNIGDSGAIVPHRWRREFYLIVTGLLLWLAPWTLISGATRAPFLGDVYLFFTQAAFVTFGGAYAVLGYVTQMAVEKFHWLSRVESLDGLSLAETTPGPLIIVLQYVGFFAGWNNGACGAARLSCGVAAAFLTTWATFLPSIVFVLIGAPHVERIGASPRLSGVFRAIGAAATGVIFALGVEYARTAVVLDPFAFPWFDAVAMTSLAIALAALRSGRVPMGAVIVVGALFGWTRYELGPWLVP